MGLGYLGGVTEVAWKSAVGSDQHVARSVPRFWGCWGSLLLCHGSEVQSSSLQCSRKLVGKLNVSELSPWQQSPAGSQHSETKAGQVCTEQGGSLLQAECLQTCSLS